MVTHNNKTNAYNAFKSLKAVDLREGNLFSSIGLLSLPLYFQTEPLPNYNIFRRSITKNMTHLQRKKRTSSLKNSTPTRRRA